MSKTNFFMILVVFLMGVSSAQAMEEVDKEESKSISIPYHDIPDPHKKHIGFVFARGYSSIDRTDATQETKYLISYPIMPCVAAVIIGNKQITYGHKSFDNVLDITQLIPLEQSYEGIEKIILYSARMNKSDYDKLEKNQHDGRSQEEELDFLKSSIGKKFGGSIETHLGEGEFRGTLAVSSAGEVFNTSFEQIVKAMNQDIKIRDVQLETEKASLRYQVDSMVGNPVSLLKKRFMTAEVIKNKTYGKYGMFSKTYELADILTCIEFGISF